MSFSEFTKDDYRVIDEAYASLLVIARRRCRNEEEIDYVQKASNSPTRPTRTCAAARANPIFCTP